MSNKLISIIIPVYNIEKYLGECLDSILNQTYQNFEIILVDDCSTDSSFNICNEYASKDKRIKVIQNDVNSGGCGIPRNIGLKHIKGDYVTFIDGDDLIPTNYLQVLINNSNGKDIAYAEYTLFGKKEEIKQEITIIRHSEILVNYFREKNLYLVSSWGKLIPKDFVNDLKFDNGFMEDTPVMYKVLLKADNLIRCNEIHYIYRVREGSLVTDDNMRKYLSVLEKTDIIEKDLKKIKASSKVMRYFYLRKIYGCLTFLKKTMYSDDQDILNARKIIEKDIRKNLFKYIFIIPKIKRKIHVLLVGLFPKFFSSLHKKYYSKSNNK